MNKNSKFFSTTKNTFSAAIYSAITPSLFSRKTVHKPMGAVEKPAVVTIPASAKSSSDRMSEKFDDRDAEGDIPEPPEFYNP